MNYKKYYRQLIALIIILSAFLPLFQPSNGGAAGVAQAATIEELQREIEERNANIKSLEQEIQHYQTQVAEVGKQANTLTNTIKSLDLSKQKISTDINVTENKIGKTNLQLSQLQLDILKKERNIQESRAIIGETFRKMNERESYSLVSTLLANVGLADFWNEIDSLNRLQGEIKVKIAELETLKAELENSKILTEKNKTTLVSLKTDLSGQKNALEQTTKEKAELLKATKSQEANYKAILAEKVARKAQLEKEIFQYESQLKIAIDPTAIPASGKGVISWPLENVRVTQYFGNTEFATQNPQIYNGSGHSGIDLGAAIGTKVLAAKDGIITATGDTDAVPGCWSYGKWVFIKHPNGLSTLYAHLSGISVSAGQAVSSGQTIGYSGNTGYSTGPHLHFGVYATQGVRITKFENSINCKGATIPLADPKAYLNPLSYL